MDSFAISVRTKQYLSMIMVISHSCFVLPSHVHSLTKPAYHDHPPDEVDDNY